MNTTSILRCAFCVAGLSLAMACQRAYAGILPLASRPALQADSFPNGTATERPARTEFHENGSIRFSGETTRLFRDAKYRADRYPAAYAIGQVPDLLDAAEIPFALWTLVNVHLSNPEQARVIAYKLAAHGIRPEHYLNAFYTYAFTDPAVFHFGEEGGAFLENPGRMEEKLESCRVLAALTDNYHDRHAGGR